MSKQSQILILGVILVVAMFSFVSSAEMNMSGVIFNDMSEEYTFTTQLVLTIDVELDSNCSYSLNEGDFQPIHLSVYSGRSSGQEGIILDFGENEVVVKCQNPNGDFGEKNTTEYRDVSEINDVLFESIGNYSLDDAVIQQSSSSSDYKKEYRGVYTNSTGDKIMFMMVFSSNITKELTGFQNISTGWVFYGEYPIRMVPTASNDMYFWSNEDMYMYTLVNKGVLPSEFIGKYMERFPSDMDSYEAPVQLNPDYEGSMSSDSKVKYKTKVVREEVIVEKVVYRDSCSSDDSPEVIRLSVSPGKKMGFFERVFGFLF